MIFARYLAHGEISYGVLDGSLLREITTTPFEPFEITNHTHDISDVNVLVPCEPAKILAVGLNYRSHLQKDVDPLEKPLIFFKTTSSLIGSDEFIIRPRSYSGRLDAEGELVVIIKERCKNVKKEEALDYVLGYTCGNDVSAREWQWGDGQWWRAKSSDTFSAVGPFIVSDLDPSTLMLQTFINGDEIQAESTEMFLFDVPTVISFVSEFMTLEPGDMIFTGTPGQPGQLYEGDVVEVVIDGIGTLRNSVKNEI